ncbi:Myotubularin- protein 14 [Haplosporangium sp. Z 27]|nr:Myotubularin- protein 14 [Haplosporangium sp. Z 27]
MIYPSQQQQQQKKAQQSSQDWSKRNLLPFAFGIPRAEKKVNVAIKEYVPPSINKKTREPFHLLVDKDKVNDTQELTKQFEKSHFARVRARFVVPCILVRGKNICRSATLSNEVEVIIHGLKEKFIDFNQMRKNLFYGTTTDDKSLDKEDKDDRESSIEKQRLEDIELLHQLGVTYINDLMVENRKVKYGLKVTSSEKVDSFGRYSNFKLVATPYPGVEFFQKFKANKYSARKLCFDWSQNFADAELQLPPGHTDNLSIRWRDYKNWDLIELTQNYLRLYLTHIADDTVDKNVLNTFNSGANGGPAPKGLLIHCISGWDRTPLFISLLRISLWADGEAHQSLTAAEILYLTMGYDWFLFNHLLADRSQRGEDIFYFCFYFLKFIYGEEFSLKSVTNLSKSGKTTHRPSFSTQPVSSPSPLLKDIGRLRGTESGNATGSEGDDSHGYVCDECKVLRKSPNETSGRNIIGAKSGSHEIASSTDGKPSSWQLVTFATPPGRDRHGSPRGQFFPTLPGASRQSGSPLGAARNSFPSGFGEQPKCGNSGLDQEALNAENPSSLSPTLLDKRFQLGLQQFNVRRSSSSGIPDLFAEDSKRVPQGGSGIEFTRVATSPISLCGGRDIETDMSSYESSRGDAGEKQTTPRKRASTFDGGLLLSLGQESSTNADDVDPKDQEDDLTSGDDDNVDEESNLARTTVEQEGQSSLPLPTSNKESPQVCQLCHHSFIAGSRQSPIQYNRAESPFSSSSRQHIPVNANMPQQSMGAGVNQALDHAQSTNQLFCGEDNEQLCRDDSLANEFDRDEGMFQLEIEDRPFYQPPVYQRDSKSELERLDPSYITGSGYKERSMDGSDTRVDNTLGARRMSSAADESEGVEGDENESFWEETSTFDYGCSPRSVLQDFGLGLTQCSPDPNTNLDRGHADEDEDDDDDDDDDDGAASLNSRRSSLKMSHDENDRLFMPSLKGVFSNADISSQDRGRQQDASNDFEVGGHPMNGMNTNSSEAGPSDSQKECGESSKSLTRRQKLKQLRRLFMDIRSEIGDGNRSPIRPVLNGKDRKGIPPEEDEDTSRSFRAESFSDDQAFQYRSPTPTAAGFMNRHGPMTNLSFKHRDYDQGQTLYNHGSSSHPEEEPYLVSPIADSQYHYQRQQQQFSTAQSSSGRKSPFEWAAAAASSAAASITTASGIVSGSFSQSSSPSMSMKQSPLLKPLPYKARSQYNSPSGSNHYSRPFALPSAHETLQQQSLHFNGSRGSGSSTHGLVSTLSASAEEYQDIRNNAPRRPSVAGERMNNGGSGIIGCESTRRRSLATSTAGSPATTSKLRGSTENSGRWDWLV